MSVMASMMELDSVSKVVRLSSRMLSWWRLAEWSAGGGFVCGGGVALSVGGPCKSGFSLVWAGGGRCFNVVLRGSWMVGCSQSVTSSSSLFGLSALSGGVADSVGGAADGGVAGLEGVWKVAGDQCRLGRLPGGGLLLVLGGCAPARFACVAELPGC